jgi:hypothetical protein
MIILSDGVSTIGNPLVTAQILGDTNVELLAGNLSSTGTAGRPEVILQTVQIPSRLRQGDSFDLNLTIEATQPISTTLALYSNGEVVYSGSLELNTGQQTYNIPLTAETTGLQTIRSPIPDEADACYQNNQLTAYTQISGTCYPGA